MSENATHYDVLEVQRNADAAAVRKAYLKASLRYHPDKNPGHEEEAKAKFVQVGQAYETLRDPAKRAAYDRELAAGKFRFTPRPSRQQRPKNDTQKTNNYASAAGEGASGRQHADEDDEAFQKFAEMFDETVSGMSEQELNMAMGAAAVVGSLIGSIVASRATKGNNAFLSSAAQMVGSAMASRAASTLVQTVHEDSKQRVLEKEERQAAIARGETVQEPSTRENKERVFQDASRAFQKVAGAAVGGGAALGGSSRISVNKFSGNGATSNRNGNSSANGNGSADRVQFSWQQAAKLAAMAAGACAEMQCASKQNNR